ncbi:MAG: glycosyltransferase family 39 protein [Planctomycetes bacterium]|nr:glycosyltransferase family 39 protein [Planctomycetota bacterium]
MSEISTETRCTSHLIAAIVFSAVACFGGTFNHSLWAPDEPRVAEIGREMFVSGDFVVPTLGGEPFLEKPPLYWWAMCGLYELFGVSDGVARLTSSVAAFALLLLIFDLTRRLANPVAGLCALFIHATTPGFFLMTLRCVVDSWLALFVFLGYYAFARILQGSESDRSRAGLVLLLYVSAGFAFLTKGPIGVALIFGPIVIWIAATRNFAPFRSWAHFPGIAALIGLCALWPYLLFQRGGSELLSEYFDGNVFGRFFSPEREGDTSAHAESIWYYFRGLTDICLYMLLLLPAAYRWILVKRFPPEWKAGAIGFLSFVLPIGVLLLSIPSAKRNLYAVPLLASMSCVLGAWISSSLPEGVRPKIDRITERVLLGLLMVASILTVVVSAVLLLDPTGGGRVPTDFREGIKIGPMVHLLGSGALTLSLCVVAHRLWRTRSEKFGVLLTLTLAIAATSFAVARGRVDEPRKNLRRLTDSLVNEGALEHPLIGFRMNETSRSIVPFYTGRIIEYTFGPMEVRDRMFGDESTMLLVFEKDVILLPDDLRSRLVLLKTIDYGERTIYKLYAFSGH